MEILINFGANTFKKACQMAAQNGYIDIVKFLISKGADNYNEIMVFAGYGGYKKIVQMMLDKGVTNFSETLHHATRGAKVEIVHLMASKGGRPINRTFEEAIKVGNIEILKMFIEMRATDTGPTWFYKNDNEIVQIAAKNGQIGIIEYILSKRVRIDFNTAFENAIIGGHKKIMMMMINHGATKLNFGLNKAVRAGHLELTKILLNLGAPIQMQALERALMSEKKEIIDLIFTTENISKITLKQVNKCLCIAASKGNLPIIKMIIQNGADNYPKAITEAANKNHKEIVRYLVDKWCEVE
jgi:ankyrin repeat protein